MPKSNPALSPPSTSTHNKHIPDDSASRMSDVALRKKKNADAQAAFRARRANYIATLEETVTSLESVVLQLQDSCREARSEAQELRQENNHLKHEFREREKLWRALWQARKAGQDVDSEDLPPLPPSLVLPNGLVGPLPLSQYGGGSLAYRVHEDVSICNPSYAPGPSHYQTQPAYVAFSGEADVPNDNSSHSLGHRAQRYSPYPYPAHAVPRETSWSPTVVQSTPSGDSGAAPSNNHSSRSPNFAASPIQNSIDLQYPSRSSAEELKTPLSSLDTAPYVFPSSRSMSPTSSTPSSSSTSLTSFPFTFPDGGGHDRADLDYRRQSHPHGAEVTLHGGTADVSLIGPASDAVRYRLGTRPLGSDRPTLLPSLPISGSENGSQHDHGSSDGDGAPYSHVRMQTRRGVQSPSRSPSPGTPAISGTLAVIKAQAFGALRRTRARAKKSEGAAKVAMDVLEARGIGIHVPGSIMKRQRVDEDHCDIPQN